MGSPDEGRRLRLGDLWGMPSILRISTQLHTPVPQSLGGANLPTIQQIRDGVLRMVYVCVVRDVNSSAK